MPLNLGGLSGLKTGDAVFFVHQGKRVDAHIIESKRHFAKVLDGGGKTWRAGWGTLFASGKPPMRQIVTEGDRSRAGMKVGDQVRFQVSGSERIRGRIIKLNPKRAKTVAEDGRTWHVPYALLDLVESPADSGERRKRQRRLDAVACEARARMDDYGLEDWTFRFTEATRTVGATYYRSKTIALSRHHVLEHAAYQVTDTILHEIAHALVGPRVGHGAKWKEVARRIGAAPKARMDEE